MLAPFIGIYNGFPHRQRIKNGLFWVGDAGRAVMECLAGPSSPPEQCRIFQDGPGEWQRVCCWLGPSGSCHGQSLTGITSGKGFVEREVWKAQRHQEHNSRAHRVRDLPFPLGLESAQILRFKFCAKPLGLLGDLSLADLCPLSRLRLPPRSSAHPGSPPCVSPP